ncbi:hypothetical protein ACFRAQ_26995 [Nocardia sp. NPDC056611]|uniref:hypothetical protein n=1 Tax=Nocardia sp. NPDC056611 TaxID=3345877 RepID=UPI00366E0557
MPDVSGLLARSAWELWPSLIRPILGITAAVLLIIAGVVLYPDDPSPGPAGSRMVFPVVIKPLPQESPPTTVPVSGPAIPPK